MGTRHLLNLTGDRLRSLPILILYLTDGCNSRCVTCDIWRNPRRNMRPGLIDALIPQIKPLGVRWIVLSGGEAMQHPDWAGTARRLRGEGARVLLLTNGLLLRKQIDDVLSSVDEVIVSLDGGTAATYAAIRGVDGFDLIMDGIRQIRDGGIPVTTRTTLQASNFREIPQIIEVCCATDVNHISFLTVDVSSTIAFGDRFELDTALPVLGLTPNEHQPPQGALTPDDVREFADVIDDVERRYAHHFADGRIAESPAKLRRMVDYFAALHDEKRTFPTVRCNAPHLSAVIEVDGSVRPCYFLPTMGKMTPTDPSLKAAINTPDALSLRAAYRAGERAECERCVCSLHKGARALIAF